MAHLRIMLSLALAGMATAACAADNNPADAVANRTPAKRLWLKPVVVRDVMAETPQPTAIEKPAVVAEKPAVAKQIQAGTDPNAVRPIGSSQADESGQSIRLAQATDELELPIRDLPDAPDFDMPDPKPFELIAPGAQEVDVASPSDEELPLPQIPDTRVVAPRTVDAAPQVAPGNAPVLAPAQSFSSADPSLFPAPSSAGPSAALGPSEVLTDMRSRSMGGRSGSSLTVISREAIRNSGHTQLSEVLRQVPGLDVVRSGGPGQQTSVFLRGANSNQTKVLLDGVPINDPGSPGRAFDFSFLSVDQIERVEVLRGPQSTLYGSDAIGGVINIITATGQGPPQANVSQMFGTYGTSQTAANVSGGNDRIFYSIGGSYEDTDGFSVASRPPGNREDDFYRNGTISGRLGWNVTSDLSVDVSARYNDATSGLDTAFDPTFTFPQDDGSTLEQQNTFVRSGLTYAAMDGLWTHRFGASYVQYDRLSKSPFGGPFYGRNNRYNWQNDALLVDTCNFELTATSGIDYLEERALATDNSFVSRRVFQDNLGGFALLSGRVGSLLYLTSGVRWDDYSLAGSAFTYRTTGRYLIGESGYQLHGAIGTGFRAPALAELLGLAGNSNLQSEESKGWEAGLSRDFAAGRGSLDITYFRNDFDDLIVFAPGPVPPFFGQLDNVGSALSSGVEVTSLVRLGETTAFANYTYTHTRDRDTGLRLLRRPRNKWSFGANRRLCCGRGNLSWSANYVGDRLDIFSFAAGRNVIADNYWLLNASGSYQWNDRVRLFGRVDNLLDDNIEEAFGFAATDIAAYFGAQLTL